MGRCCTPISHRYWIAWLPPLLLFLLSSLPSPFLATDGDVGQPPVSSPSFNCTIENVCRVPNQTFIDAATASLGTKWSTGDIAAAAANETAGWSVVPALLLRNSGPSFACGLLCRRDGEDNTTGDPCQDSILFGVFLVVVNSSSNITTDAGKPEVVWSAKRDRPLKGFAALNFTAAGNLQLEDGGGDTVWSSDTSASDIARMNLTSGGNLILYNRSNRVVWQSFDHPTDTVLLGQSLTGKKLVTKKASASPEVRFLLEVNDTTYSSFVEFNRSAPQIYYQSNRSLEGGVLLPLPRNVSRQTELHPNFAESFARLETDGRFILHKWSAEERVWQSKRNLTLDGDYREGCAIPIACMTYGFCTVGGCSCPRRSNKEYFEYVNYSIPKFGCHEKTPLSCHRTQLLDYGEIDFYAYRGKADFVGIDVKTCKANCEKNCSCRGAFFKYGSNASSGDCYLPSVILSLTKNQWQSSGYNSTAFLKVQQINAMGPSSDSQLRHWMVPTAIAILCCLVFAGILYAAVILRRGRHRREEKGEEELEEFTHLPGMPTRFAYEELTSATSNFSTKLGEGGFGAVFLGTLVDGARIAVKILGCRGQGMKEFLAEVQTIGSIHHVNLVRLMGYCVDGFHRLLVYEFLSKGSLDRWIFNNGEASTSLDWPIRYKIALDVARGLSYLHEECRQRIIHLDIKPQNILLDDKFNAKVSDFGLSKLVERDQSQVVTTLRGTPGYMAPEWLSSVITEKVDVYSFGVVVLELVSGRRVLDHVRSQGKVNLVSMLKKAAKEDRLLDMVGWDCKEEEEEARKMVRVAMWCLRGDYSKRPPMSAVVKVLEGVMDVEVLDVDDAFWVPPMGEGGSEPSGSTPLLPSLLSGPR